MKDLITLHHEMAHIQYFLRYSGLPREFRDGANPGMKKYYISKIIHPSYILISILNKHTTQQNHNMIRLRAIILYKLKLKFIDRFYINSQIFQKNV